MVIRQLNKLDAVNEGNQVMHAKSKQTTMSVSPAIRPIQIPNNHKQIQGKCLFRSCNGFDPLVASLAVGVSTITTIAFVIALWMQMPNLSHPSSQMSVENLMRAFASH